MGHVLDVYLIFKEISECLLSKCAFPPRVDESFCCSTSKLGSGRVTLKMLPYSRTSYT